LTDPPSARITPVGRVIRQPLAEHLPNERVQRDLEDGAITEASGHEELMDRGATYAEFFTLQAAAYQAR
jgi:hypothetical protein